MICLTFGLPTVELLVVRFVGDVGDAVVGLSLLVGADVVGLLLGDEVGLLLGETVGLVLGEVVGLLVGGTKHICGPVLLKSHSPSCLHLMVSEL